VVSGGEIVGATNNFRFNESPIDMLSRVVDAGEILLAPIRDSLRRHLPFSGKYPIPSVVAATLGNKAGLVGAADLAAR
ncbi:MAG: hypothetical protein EBY87_03875, partial [Actinobacteria bacterium]|nr:hypothetical protein [Actinomycetota bacterium]